MKAVSKKILLHSLAFFVLGILVGGYMYSNYANKPSSGPSTNIPSPNNISELHNGEYQLINPLYECNTGQPYGTIELFNLRNAINDYINQVTANNSVTTVAVMFRDLNTGRWFGINQHDDFSPSSLLKVPVMIAYYQEAENNPSILSKEIIYTQDPYPVLPQYFGTKDPIQKGKTYTIEQLIEHMIIHSDNAALGLLEANISNARINQVTLDLNITTATDSTPADFMDVSDYATLVRVLYYSTYLNRDYSEKALEILSKADFNQGLVALLPKNIVVAHKYGEREFPDGTHQLHDCGIIYYPNHPYLLCIMTRGPDYNDLATTIQKISLEVYKEMTAHN